MTEAGVVSLVALLTWTVIMFWVSLISMVVDWISNRKAKQRMLDAYGVDDLSLIPILDRHELEDTCSHRFWAPVKFWMLGVALIVVVGLAFHFTSL